VKNAFSDDFCCLQTEFKDSAPGAGSGRITSLPTSAVSQFGCGTLHSLAINAISLLRSLPPMSHFRGLLLALLLKDLSTESACQLATVAESTLFAARHEYQYGQLGDLAQAYASHVHRERTPAEELADMSALIKDECPPKSGTRRVHWDQLDSDKQLREKYRTEYASSLVKLVENARNKTEMSPALRTLLSKFRDHEKKFAFLSFVHSAPSASEAFAGGSRRWAASGR